MSQEEHIGPASSTRAGQQQLSEECIRALVAKAEDARRFIDNIVSKPQSRKAMLCFNGGKDCTVLLHLLYCYYNDVQQPLPKTLYIRSANAFEEVNQFVDDAVKRYGLQLYAFEGNMKEILALVQQQEPDVQYMYMGTRRTDPHCANYSRQEPTDPDWPQFQRIFPLIDWSYSDVWNYISHYNVPYCRLYDDGYTSLGDKSNTKPNPALKRCVATDSSSEQVIYAPAYELHEEHLERANREQQTTAAATN